VHHETKKNYQLDLFDPDDGYFEYSAVSTNSTLNAAALWGFMAGRGAQEKTFAELKGEWAWMSFRLITMGPTRLGSKSLYSDIT